MRRARTGGDREEFAEVFEAHRDDVVRLAYLLSGDPEGARDAAAEAFARTYEHWRRGKVDRIEGYVRRAVINQVNSQFRRRGRQRSFEQRRTGDARGATAHDDRTVVGDEMRRLLRRLPQRQRSAVVLRFWEDLTIEEIARAMDCPTGTVKSLLSRGMARLRMSAEHEALREEARHG